jgi:threonine/homoserine/homoserine lactone efflux protein|tara:strand:- start:365 stop:979 length:615 start_codon:yes stop_codon:yes gene_type:complete
MLEIFSFLGLVIVISASGVMSPGPLFAANVMYGLREGKISGIKMAIGHTIVEFPLILLLGVGFFSIESIPEIRTIITILGAIGLFGFAILQIRSVTKQEFSLETKSGQGPFMAGILLSALNPFFIIWWLTIGLVLISESIQNFGIIGIVILFLFHIWMDYAWLFTIAIFSSKAKNYLSKRNFKMIIIGLSVVLIYFGIDFVLKL